MAGGRSQWEESQEGQLQTLWLAIINKLRTHYAKTPNPALSGIIFKTQSLIASYFQRRELVRSKEQRELRHLANKVPQ